MDIQYSLTHCSFHQTSLRSYCTYHRPVTVGHSGLSCDIWTGLQGMLNTHTHTHTHTCTHNNRHSSPNVNLDMCCSTHIVKRPRSVKILHDCCTQPIILMYKVFYNDSSYRLSKLDNCILYDSRQSRSSDQSPQSLSSLQTNDAGIQRPLLAHLNWSSRHATQS